VALAAYTVEAAGPNDGGLLGYVENGRGIPLPGAVVSVFGRGIGPGFTTLTDSTGRFFLPALPAGSYTLRALREGHRPAPARRIIVLPNQDATFTLNLTPMTDAVAEESDTQRVDRERDQAAVERELRWLLRHKRRSVLEEQQQGTDTTTNTASASTSAAPPHVSWLDVDGSVEFLARPSAVGMGGPVETADDEPTSFSVLRLQGRIADAGRWTLSGAVAERDTTAWRMAGEFVLTPGGGHEILAATGYGSRYLRVGSLESYVARPYDRSVGAVHIQDRWELNERIATTVGSRFSYTGYLADAHHFDPHASVEIRRDDHTRVRGSVDTRTVVPGGDVLTLTRLATAPSPAFTMPAEGIRAERFTRYEIGVDQEFGKATVAAHTFFEGVHDQIVNTFSGEGQARVLHVGNGGGSNARGMGLSVSRRFGESVKGSVTYLYGLRTVDTLMPDHPTLTFRVGGFHDVTARVETFIQGTDTRLVAFYRLNRLSPETAHRFEAEPVRNMRYEVQLSQGLPFLGSLTRADWDVLVAVRNLFYETAEGAVLDEMAVSHPPRRVLGGISVRF
jgi:hypothetical protein